MEDDHQLRKLVERKNQDVPKDPERTLPVGRIQPAAAQQGTITFSQPIKRGTRPVDGASFRFFGRWFPRSTTASVAGGGRRRRPCS